MRIGLAMVVSVWIHIIGFTLLRYVDPLPAPLDEPPPLALEIELPEEPPPPEPPVAELPKETPMQPEKETAAPAPPVPIPVDPNQSMTAEGPEGGTEQPGTSFLEDTISLESKAPQYVTYLGRIKASVKQHWIFPPEARQRRQTGGLSAMFTLDKTGRLIRIVVEESSGNQILDHAALEAVRGASPFPPFPDHINLDRLNIKAKFDYRIKFVSIK